MDEVVKGIFTAPLATLFIISGVVFLFVAVVGNISGKIEPDTKSRIISGILGLAFIVIGLSIHFTQKETDTRPLPKAMPEQMKPDQVTKTPQKPTPKETEILNNAPVSASNTEDKEPNDQVTIANLITEGTTIRGSISTKQDRDFFQIKTSSNKTRVILRKISVPGFYATVEIFNSVEEKITEGSTGYEHYDDPVSLSFESTAGSIYFIVVMSNYKNFTDKYTGDYELTVRKE